MTTNARLQGELRTPAPIGPGKSAGAKRVQEYLVINGIKLTVDGDWGPATSRAVDLFARGATKVDQALMDRLAEPILRAIAPLDLRKIDVRAAIVTVATRHLAQHPIEVGGQNAGPWVRLYMDGNEGNAWPWCMGFATWVVRQAAEGAGVAIPAHLKRTYSCDVVGAAAKKAGKLVRGTAQGITPGDVFLVPGKKAGDWVHTGIIVGVDATTFTTIEGNTNDEGSREGFEVCRRIRNRASLDVVLL